MAPDVWWSLGLGAGLGLLYGLASFLTLKRAERQPTRRFLIVFMGGMMVRMAVALTLFALVIALAPVRQPVFVAAFFAVFLVGLALEVASVHRGAART